MGSKESDPAGQQPSIVQTEACTHTLLELVNDQVSVLSHDVTCRVCDTLI